MEQALVQEGLLLEEIQRLCMSMPVFKASIEEIHRPLAAADQPDTRFTLSSWKTAR